MDTLICPTCGCSLVRLGFFAVVAEFSRQPLSDDQADRGGNCIGLDAHIDQPR